MDPYAHPYAQPWRSCARCAIAFQETMLSNGYCAKCILFHTPTTAQSEAATGSKDGTGAGDNDMPYVFGRVPHANAPFPFTVMQFAHLIIQRSKWETGGERLASRTGTERLK